MDTRNVHSLGSRTFFAGARFEAVVVFFADAAALGLAITFFAGAAFLAGAVFLAAAAVRAVPADLAGAAFLGAVVFVAVALVVDLVVVDLAVVDLAVAGFGLLVVLGLLAFFAVGLF